MRIGPTEILDTTAEAFSARFTRLLITAGDDDWLNAAIQAFTGYGSSVIGCDVEVGSERILTTNESPDGRAAAAVLCFAFSTRKLAAAVGNRVGQCVLTCPTTACYSGLKNTANTIRLGDHVRFFGDGHEQLEADVWKIPVMDGEFIVDRVAGVGNGVAGGNLIIQSDSQASGLAAAQRAVGLLASRPGVIVPFPGGVCRSGSKVGSKYKKLIASTHEAFCPTLRDRVPSQLVAGANCAYEIVINGIDRETVAAAMRTAIEAAAGERILAIGAGNYGGRLGKIEIGLHDLFR